jgi:DNA-binding response OmpR family regulator
MNALRGTEDPPPTVLVVEDDHDLASLLVMMFEREGFATLRAATQHEATTLLRQRRPDVLVLDIYPRR